VINGINILLPFAKYCSKPFDQLDKYELSECFAQFINQKQNTLTQRKVRIRKFLRKINPDASATIEVKIYESNVTPDQMLTADDNYAR
jgi:hypothetical protein